MKRRLRYLWLTISIILWMSSFLGAVIPDLERDVLLKLYFDTDGENWANNTNWGKTDPTITAWYGVTTAIINGEDHVTELFLRSNGLKGTIPEELANLEYLKYLYLDNNQLSGEIPDQLSGLTRLERLYLSKNSLEGTIPKELGNLSALKFLILNNNRLEGSVPTELGNLSQLVILTLQGNRLQGDVPVSFTKLSNLTGIDLSYNALYSDNAALTGFLDGLSPDWFETQTIAPQGLDLDVAADGTVQLTWEPVAFQEIGGVYEVFYGTSASGPFTQCGETASKTDVTFDITGLSGARYYYFVVRTRTYAHAGNTNEVVSHYSDYTVSRQPEIGFNRSRLVFVSLEGEVNTPAQECQIRNRGNGTLHWSIADAPEWLEVTPDSGSTSTQYYDFINVSLDSAVVEQMDKGTYEGLIIVESPEAANSPQTIDILFTIKDESEDEPPLGQFLTPLDSSTQRSSIPVTGWVLDDVGIKHVQIYRDPVTGEGMERIYIGEANFVEGARPDIAELYPDYPANYKAGWGYMMLSNFLPSRGNGDFTLIAIAQDIQGNETILGRKPVTIDNEHAYKPFGALDTPAQGGDAAGDNYYVQGWVVTPLLTSSLTLDNGKHIPMDGSTIHLFVDGIKVQEGAQYDLYRSDIAHLFPYPDYLNGNGAAAWFLLDTTAGRMAPT